MWTIWIVLQALVLLLSANDVIVLHCTLHALIGLAQRYVLIYYSCLAYLSRFLVCKYNYIGSVGTDYIDCCHWLLLVHCQ